MRVCDRARMRVKARVEAGRGDEMARGLRRDEADEAGDGRRDRTGRHEADKAGKDGRDGTRGTDVRQLGGRGAVRRRHDGRRCTVGWVCKGGVWTRMGEAARGILGFLRWRRSRVNECIGTLTCACSYDGAVVTKGGKAVVDETARQGASVGKTAESLRLAQRRSVQARARTSKSYRRRYDTAVDEGGRGSCQRNSGTGRREYVSRGRRESYVSKGEFRYS